MIRPHGMCYSHLGNGVRNGAISITQWGFISGYYKVKSIGQWGKILVMAMGFEDRLGLGRNRARPQIQRFYSISMFKIPQKILVIIRGDKP